MNNRAKQLAGEETKADPTKEQIEAQNAKIKVAETPSAPAAASAPAYNPSLRQKAAAGASDLAAGLSGLERKQAYTLDGGPRKYKDGGMVTRSGRKHMGKAC